MKKRDLTFIRGQPENFVDKKIDKRSNRYQSDIFITVYYELI